MQRKILKMQEKHLEKLAQSLNEYDDFWNEKILNDEFYNENSEYFVICENETVCGFAGLWFNIDEAHIMNIAVKKDFRKKGIGSELLNFLIDEAKNKKKMCITLEVRDDNIPAIELYKKFDFDIIGRRKKYYNNCNDAIIMTKFFTHEQI